MQRLLGTAAAAALSLLTSPVLAFDLGGGFTIAGEVELEHVSDSTESQSLVAGDVTLGWRNAASGGLGFGFDFTVDTLFLVSDSEDVTAYWGGLVIGTAVGEFTLGAARPVNETVYSFPSFGTSQVTEFRLLPVNGSFITFFSIIADDVAAGVSLEGSSGALSYGVSLHELDSPGDRIRSSQIALSYALANTILLGGFEVIGTSGGTSLSSYRFGVVHEMDALKLGAEVSIFDGALTGTESFSRLHAAYDVTEALTLSADYGHNDSATGSDNVWALGAEYRFGSGGFVQAGTTDLGDDDIWDVGIGLRF